MLNTQQSSTTMDTTYDISAILDELYEAENTHRIISLLSGKDISAIGCVELYHNFGIITDFSTALNPGYCDFLKSFTEEIEEIKEDAEDVDSIMLSEFYWEDKVWFLLPIEETATRNVCIMFMTGVGEFDPECLENTKDTKSVDNGNQRGYSQSRVSNIVKMVNSGENIHDVVEGLDEEEEETVLSFRGEV